MKGVLKTWKEDRGFGFITPDNGGRDVFIHITALGEIDRRPLPGDTIHYQVTRDRNGKFRAINAQIDGVLTNNQTTKNAPKAKSTLKWLLAAGTLVISIVGIIYYLKSTGYI